MHVAGASTGIPARRLVVLLALFACLVADAAAQAPTPSTPAPTVEVELERVAGLVAKSRYPEAATVLQALRQAGGGTPHQRARILHRLAAVQLDVGEVEEAFRTADEGESVARGAGAGDVLRAIAVVRGSGWRARGFPYRGIGYYEAALADAERAGDTRVAANALSHLAAVHQELGDWSRVVHYAERAFRQRASPSVTDRLSYLGHRGIAYYEFDDRTRAHAAFQEVLEVARQAGNRRGESFALGELAMVAWEFDRDYPRALDLFGQALAIARASRLPALEVSWLTNMGGVYRDSGRLPEALATYHEAVAIEERIGQQRDRPYLLKNIGQVQSMQGRLVDAERHLLEAMRLADEQNVPKIRWMSRMELGDVHRTRDPVRAGQYFAEGLQVLEDSRGTVLMERLRAGVLGRSLARYDVFDRYIQFLLERGEPEKAFAIAERARARIFLETLGTARAELARAIPQEYRDAEGALLSEISGLQSQLRQVDMPAAKRRELVAGIERAEDALASLRVRLAVEQPALAQLRFPRIWEAGDVQRTLLAPDERIAMFFLGQKASACWLVGPDGTTVITLPARDEIEKAVRELLPTLQSPAARVDDEALGWLSSTLMAPVASKVPPGTHLIVVPHAILHYLPFEMLHHPAGGHLVEHVTVSYAPSVSSLAHLRQLKRPLPRPASLLALGSPNLGTRGTAGTRATALAWIGELKPLPYARTEIRRIAAAFSPASRVLEGRDATEDALSSDKLGNVGVLHLATHALIDEEHPERSALALARGPGPSDGVLQAREVYALDLDATLVTLSACQTALGRQVTGEGLVGLSRAFFYAGAGAVTASLWNVSDAATADLMTSFYHELRRGKPIDRALAEAKRSFIAGNPARRHPYYWAPFIVAGHARAELPAAAPARAAPSVAAIVAAATGLLVVGFGVAVLLRARRHAEVHGGAGVAHAVSGPVR